MRVVLLGLIKVLLKGIYRLTNLIGKEVKRVLLLSK